MSGPSFLIDHLVDEHLEMRQMCAKVTPQLMPPRGVLNLLDMSKREFVELLCLML
jgi:hypothetical protein